ncbi:nicotinamide/nicotinic acid mononucleotide adenylyltransferase 3 isoform X2 [Eupeodes corollae]|uniref:nicotinamide/nicotinic acid mononucleotide adenylyltransferase 3 isoform X2 n=1 Tax=Eupeodes corollae TaxID=290404 RepID=UPI0024912E28|nr:nicotinamide/nicotinic acid mononucleotide adenylyltransferase 3 isoform X2 [Eupeodes corollae]
MSNQIEKSTMLPSRIVLIACGSFSPPTPMHFRMFEIARDYFEMMGTHSVIGGIISPTHDSYGKKGLAPAKHRFAMVKLALQSSDWIRASDWEIEKNEWSRTQQVLQFHQNYMNNYINSPFTGDSNIVPGWLPRGLRDRREKVQLKLLCGGDLLESFAVPGLWANQDIEDIVCNHGLVVITRSGTNPEKFIFDSDILTKYQKNITLITNWVPNEVSSTMIRRLLNRGQSVKYLIDDLVLEYIKLNGLFNYKTIHLDNDHPRIFCCGNSDSIGSKLLSRLPGQAVQIITDSPNGSHDQDEIKAKKVRKSSPEMV